MSSISIRKFLLAGTALVAASVISAQAQAQVTLTGAVTWGETASGTNGSAGLGAGTGDSVALGGNTLTITNDGVAYDGTAVSPNHNTFTLGAVTNASGAGVVDVAQAAAGTANPLAVTISSIATGGTDALTITSNNAAESAGVGQNVTVGITNGLALGGNLTLTNQDTSSTGAAISLTVATTTAVTGTSAISASGAAAGDSISVTNTGDATYTGAVTLTAGTGVGSNATITLSGAGTNAFSGGLTLNDAGSGLAELIVNGATAQTITGAITAGTGGQGTLISNNSGGLVTFSGNVGGTGLASVVLDGTNGTTFSGNVGATAISIAGAGTDTFGGTVGGAITFSAAGTADLNGGTLTGSVNFAGNAGIVNVAAGDSITSFVNNSVSGGANTLDLMGGTQTVGGAVGGSNAVSVVDAGQAAGATTFSSTVNATTIDIGTGSATFDGAVSGAINLGGNGGTVTVTATSSGITGAVDNSSGSGGTLDMAGGTQTVSGAVGATGALAQVDAGQAGGATTFDQAVTATNIAIGSGSAIFNSVGGTVSATTITVGTGSATFDQTVTLGAGGAIDFGGNNGTVTIASGKNIAGTGVVENSSGTGGTLDMAGGTQSVAGNVGPTGALALVDAGQTAGDTTTFDGTVNAATVDIGAGKVAFDGTVTLGGSGAINFGGLGGSATVASGANIVGAVDNLSGATSGTLDLLGGTQSVSGNVGATAGLAVVDAGQAAGATTFDGTVNATTINVGTGSATFDDAVTATTITVGAGSATFDAAASGAVTFSGAGTVDLDGGLTGSVNFAGQAGIVNVAAGENISSFVNNSVSGGANTLDLMGGTQTVTGAVGSSNAVAVVDAGQAGGATTFSSTVNATTINIGTGSAAFDGAVSGAINLGSNGGTVTVASGISITGAVDNLTGSGTGGTLDLLGGSQTVSGEVGTTGTLAQIDAGQTSGQTTTFSSTAGVEATTISVGAGNVKFDGTVTGTIDLGGNDGTVIVASGKNIEGAVENSTGTGGELALQGGTQTVSGAVGGGTSALTLVAAGQSGGATTFGSTVNATTIDIGSGSATFGGTVTGAINYLGAGGTVNVASGASIVGTVDNSAGTGGTLNLEGGTQNVSGTIGATGTLAVLDAGQAGGATSFSNTVAATTVNIDTGSATFGSSATVNATSINIGTGSATFDADATGNLLFSGQGTATIANSVSFDGNIGGTGGAVGSGVGNVVFLGGSSDIGTIGAGGTILKSLTLSGSGATVSTTGAVLAADTTTFGTNTLAAGGSFGIGTGQTLQSTITSTSTYGTITAGPVVSGKGTDAVNVATGTLVNLTNSISGYMPTTTFVLASGTGGTVNALGNGDLTVDGHTDTGATSVTIGFIKYSMNTADQALDELAITADNLGVASEASSANNASVAGALDTIGVASGPNAAVLNTIQADLESAPNAGAVNKILGTLSPTVDGSSQMAALEVSSEIMDLTDTRMAALRADDGTSGVAAGASDNGVSMWVQGYGEKATQDERNEVAGYGSKIWGGAAGMDSTNMINNGIFGVALNYGRASADSDNLNTTSTDIDNYGLTFYSTANLDRELFLSGQFGYAYNKIGTIRHDAGIAGADADGSTHSDQYDGKLLLGRDYAVDYGTLFTPDIFTTYNHLGTEGYTETGSGANLTVDSNSENELALGLGGTMSWKLKNPDGSLLKPALHADYSYAVVNDQFDTDANFAGITDSPTFVTTGISPDRNRVDLGASVIYMTTADWDMSANYNFEYRPDYRSDTGTLRATAHF